MLQQPLSISLWLIAIILQALLLALLASRRHFHDYPAFTTFAAIKLIKSLALLALFGHQDAYYYAYWTLMAISSISLFVAIHEIFRKLFQPYHTLPRQAVADIICAFILLAAVVIVITSDPAASTTSAIENAMLTFDRAWLSLATGALLIIVGSAGVLGLPLRNQLFGFTTGTAFYLAVSVVSSFIAARSPLIAGMALQYVERIAWTLSLVIWCSYAAMAPHVKREITPEQLARLVEFTKQLKNAVRRIESHARQPFGSPLYRRVRAALRG